MAGLIDFAESSGTPNTPGTNRRLLYALADGLYQMDDAGVAGKLLDATATGYMRAADGRLTLTSGTPVTTSDVTGATTLYYCPYVGNQLALWDGAQWLNYDFTEVSLSLSGWTASKNYDIWAYQNSGTVTLDYTVWTNDTTRATALAYQDGTLVKSGDATRRYLGTIRTTASTGQCEDSLTKRYVWNRYNRENRHLFLGNATSHTYTGSTAFRAWNNAANSTTQVYFVSGVESKVIASIASTMRISSASYNAKAMLFYDGIVNSIISMTLSTTIDNIIYGSIESLDYFLGYHYLQMGETITNTSATGTFTDCYLNCYLEG